MLDIPCSAPADLPSTSYLQNIQHISESKLLDKIQYHRVANSRPGYYCKNQPFPKGHNQKIFNFPFKVQLFQEGHKNWRNLPHGFNAY